MVTVHCVVVDWQMKDMSQGYEESKLKKNHKISVYKIYLDADFY